MDALIVGGAQAAALTDALDQVVTTASARYRIRADAELHGFDLFQGSGDWAGLPPRARIGVYNQAFEAIAKQDAKIILRGVHRPSLTSRYRLPRRPHEIVLQHLLARIDEHAANLGLFTCIAGWKRTPSRIYEQPERTRHSGHVSSRA